MYEGTRFLARARRLDTFRNDKDIMLECRRENARSLIQWHDGISWGGRFCATFSMATCNRGTILLGSGYWKRFESHVHC